MRISDVSQLTTHQDYIDAFLSLIENTSRYLRIRSAYLDPSLFNEREVIEAISQFARSSRFTEVHILLDYPEYLLRNGHRLLDLSRRLSHKILIKEYYSDKIEQQESLIISDCKGILIKYQDADTPGLLSLTDAVTTKRLQEAFVHDWERSSLARQLRQLSI